MQHDVVSFVSSVGGGAAALAVVAVKSVKPGGIEKNLACLGEAGLAAKRQPGGGVLGQVAGGDVTWCGLSIHHLSTDGKRKLLGAICGATRDVAMIYEPTLAEGEDREAYLARFRRVNRPAWTFLTDEEWSQIDHHVTTCDLPEHAATWLALGREAGFSKASQIFLDPTGFYGLYRYDR